MEAGGDKDGIGALINSHLLCVPYGTYCLCLNCSQHSRNHESRFVCYTLPPRGYGAEGDSSAPRYIQQRKGQRAIADGREQERPVLSPGTCASLVLPPLLGLEPQSAEWRRVAGRRTCCSWRCCQGWSGGCCCWC